eukprot:Nitzschia sp. Nitz4//scaffold307_size21646//2971//4002//NITZ4_008594-RA/size21646-processed-gene-0.16-mRNA-1//1//CDS//3329547127//1356//frame0
MTPRPVERRYSPSEFYIKYPDESNRQLSGLSKTESYEEYSFPTRGYQTNMNSHINHNVEFSHNEEIAGLQRRLQVVKQRRRKKHPSVPLTANDSVSPPLNNEQEAEDLHRTRVQVPVSVPVPVPVPEETPSRVALDDFREILAHPVETPPRYYSHEDEIPQHPPLKVTFDLHAPTSSQSVAQTVDMSMSQTSVGSSRLDPRRLICSRPRRRASHDDSDRTDARCTNHKPRFFLRHIPLLAGRKPCASSEKNPSHAKNVETAREILKALTCQDDFSDFGNDDDASSSGSESEYSAEYEYLPSSCMRPVRERPWYVRRKGNDEELHRGTTMEVIYYDDDTERNFY